jgi:hypothetical protein
VKRRAFISLLGGATAVPMALLASADEVIE